MRSNVMVSGPTEAGPLHLKLGRSEINRSPTSHIARNRCYTLRNVHILCNA